jgi:hypothetical protein
MYKSASVEGLYMDIVTINGKCQIFLLQFQMIFKYGMHICKLKLHLTHYI